MSNNPIRVAGVNPLAIKQAAMLDDTFFDHVDVVFDADLIKKTSAIVIKTDIERCFDLDIRKDWPRFDTGRTEDGEIDYSCNNPDWTKTMNGKRTVWVSYFDTIVLRSARAMSITAKIENIKDVNKQEKKRTIILDNEADIKTLETKLSSYKQTFRKAINLLQKEEQATQLYPELVVQYRRDAEDGVKQVAEPIMCYPGTRPLLGANFTVTQFMSLDFEVDGLQDEADPEKKWDLLLSTMTREQPEEEDDADNIQINNYKRFETGCASMLYLLEEGSFTTKLYGMFDRAKDIAPHADLIKTLNDLAIEFNSIAQHLKAPKPGKGAASTLLARAIAVETDVEEANAVQGASVGNPEVPYSPEEYIGMNIGKYRTDYPGPTFGLSDKKLFDLVMTTDDDMEPAQWRSYFVKNNPSAKAA